MNSTTRRRFLGTTALLGAASATGVAGATTSAAEGRGTVATGAGHPIVPGSVQYEDLSRGVNQRWSGTPDWIRVPRTSEQVVAGVQKAVDSGRRIAVRGGGHCFEDFVSGRSVRAVIDLSALDSVEHDTRRRALAVGAGARLGQVNEQLFKRWGIALPAGACPTVGIGGHISGGGYGPLNRLHGLTVDHLYAVEVVVVDGSGTARAVTATREKDDPRRDLWWAHTGGGGGNFGVVTRYWFRSPGAAGADAGRLLPAPPPCRFSAIGLTATRHSTSPPPANQAGLCRHQTNRERLERTNPQSLDAAPFRELKW